MEASEAAAKAARAAAANAAGAAAESYKSQFHSSGNAYTNVGGTSTNPGTPRGTTCGRTNTNHTSSNHPGSSPRNTHTSSGTSGTYTSRPHANVNNSSGSSTARAYSTAHAWDGGDSQWSLLEAQKTKGLKIRLRDLPELTKQTVERAVLLEGTKKAFQKLAKRWSVVFLI